QRRTAIVAAPTTTRATSTTSTRRRTRTGSARDEVRRPKARRRGERGSVRRGGRHVERRRRAELGRPVVVAVDDSAELARGADHRLPGGEETDAGLDALDADRLEPVLDAPIGAEIEDVGVGGRRTPAARVEDLRRLREAVAPAWPHVVADDGDVEPV